MKRFFVLLLLFVPAILSAQVYNVLTYANNNEIVNGIKIKTQIPVSTHQQPKIHIDGYELNIGTISLDIGWYAESGTIYWASCSSSGGYGPTVTLSVVSGKIHIFIGGTGGYAYAPRFVVTAYAEGLDETSGMFTGWTVADEALSGTNQTLAYSYNFSSGQISANTIYTYNQNCNGMMQVGQRANIGSTSGEIKEALQVTGNVSLSSNANSFKFNNYYNTIYAANRYVSNGYAGTLKLDTAGKLIFANTAASGTYETTATFSNRFAITKEGKTGIGTTDPKELLQVAGNITTAGNNKSLLFNIYNNSGKKFLSSGYGAAFTFDSTGMLYYSNTSASGSADGSATLNNVFAINKSGVVGIGTTNLNDAGYKLFVESGIRARKVKVDQSTWSDYVFDADYKLRPLQEVEAYIKSHKHLPDVLSAGEIKEQGNDLGATQSILLKKIEELTLYLIDQNKAMVDQSKIISGQNKKIDVQHQEILELKFLVKKLSDHEK